MKNFNHKPLTSLLILFILLSLTLTACTNGKESTLSSPTTSVLPVTDLYWDPDPATLVTSPSGVLPGNFVVILVFKNPLTAAQENEFLSLPVFITDAAGNRYDYFQATLFDSVKRAIKRGRSVLYFFNLQTDKAPFRVSVSGRNSPVNMGDPFSEGGSC